MQYHNGAATLLGNVQQAERSSGRDKGSGGLKRWIRGDGFLGALVSLHQQETNTLESEQEREIKVDIGGEE